jgi:hypothetical protein
MKRGASREHTLLWKWLERGAPADEDVAPPRRGLAERDANSERVAGSEREAGSQAPLAGGREAPQSARARGARPRARAGREPALQPQSSHVRGSDVRVALDRGMENLPLSPQQRAHAKDLARDLLARVGRASRKPPGPASKPDADVAARSLAAAIAYAIVFVDGMPLTQAEVAAPFRVSVARLRGRFAQLRTGLDLSPGDRRYRS